MEDFEYAATHKGKECAEYYAAEYMINCDGLIIGYRLQTRKRSCMERG